MSRQVIGSEFDLDLARRAFYSEAVRLVTPVMVRIPDVPGARPSFRPGRPPYEDVEEAKRCMLQVLAIDRQLREMRKGGH